MSSMQPQPAPTPDNEPKPEVQFPHVWEPTPSEQVDLPPPHREEAPPATPEYRPASPEVERRISDLEILSQEILAQLPPHDAERSTTAGPVFGGFRALFRLPGTLEGLVTLIHVKHQSLLCPNGEGEPSSHPASERFIDPFDGDFHMLPRQATALAEGTFPRGTPGYFLAENLAMALLIGRLDLFTEHDRTRYAALYGAQEFSNDYTSARLCERWILGQTSPVEEKLFELAMGAQGYTVRPVIPGRLWVQSPRAEFNAP